MTPAEEEWFTAALVKIRLIHGRVYSDWARYNADKPHTREWMKFWLDEAPNPWNRPHDQR